MKTKAHLRFIKEEKRIVKLLYRKGMLYKYNINPITFKWSSYIWGRRCLWIPTIVVCDVDYWGEGQEYEVISRFINSHFGWDYDNQGR